MSASHPVPVLLLAHLGAETSPPAALTALAEKFRQTVAPGLGEIAVETIDSAARLTEVLEHPDYAHRLAILHLSGTQHRWKEVAPVLCRQLPGRRGLEHLFLNGLATEPEADQLVGLGLKSVLHTHPLMLPAIGHQLAERFFLGLANGAYLVKAWNEATASVQIRVSAEQVDKLYQPGAPVEARYPWDGMRIKNGARSVLNWNLPDAVQDPTAGLPEPQFGAFPAEPFRELQPYLREHAPVFFGRARYIRALYNHVTNPEGPGVVCLYGSSGVGKTSLLAAGLSPYLERDFQLHTLQFRTDLSLSDQLRAALAPAAGAEDLSLPQLWKSATAAENRPPLVIFDQAEELFTNSQALQQDAAARWGALLGELFGDRRDPLPGKVLLSYRQAFHPDVEQLLSTHDLPFAKVFLARFSEAEIKTVVKGPASTPELQEAYRIEVEETLPENMARFLLEDPDSAVSPVLQLLLSALWKKVQRHSGGVASFSNAAFNQLRTEGDYLATFFQEQLDRLQAIHPDFVACGLVTDLMSFLVSKKQTTLTRSEAELLARYPQHRDVALRQLLDDMVRLNLLTVRGPGFTLGHDLLAPLALTQYQLSLLPGQRAERLLQQKAAFFAEADPTTLPSRAEAQLIEAGKMGMATPAAVPEKMVWWKPEWFLSPPGEDYSVPLRILGILLAGLGVFALLFGVVLVSNALLGWLPVGTEFPVDLVLAAVLTLILMIVLVRTGRWRGVTHTVLALIVALICVLGIAWAFLTDRLGMILDSVPLAIGLAVLLLFPFIAAFFLFRNLPMIKKYFQRNAVIAKIREYPLTNGYFVLFRTALSGKIWQMFFRAIFSFTAVFIYTIIGFLVVALLSFIQLL